MIRKSAIEGLLSRTIDVAPSVLANAAMGLEDLIPLWFGEPD